MLFASRFWYQPDLHIHQKCVHSIKPDGYRTPHFRFPLNADTSSSSWSHHFLKVSTCSHLPWGPGVPLSGTSHVLLLTRSVWLCVTSAGVTRGLCKECMHGGCAGIGGTLGVDTKELVQVWALAPVLTLVSSMLKLQWGASTSSLWMR